MPISFNDISNTIRTPGRYTEIDGTGAVDSTPAETRRVLFVGERLAAGTRTQLNVDRILSDAQAESYYGIRSWLASAIVAFRSIHKSAEIHAVSIDEHGSGVAAAGTFAFTGPATASGSIAIYVGGRRYSIAVASGDTATAIAAALDAEIDLDDRRYMLASNATGTLTVTAAVKGPVGNEIELAINLRDGEALPAGIACVVTQPSSGATAPDVSAVIAALPEVQYHTVISTISDATNIGLIEDELTARWGGDQQIDGVLFVAKNDSLANLLTFGSNRNSPFSVVVAAKDQQSPPWITSAMVGAHYAREPHPARPYNTLLLPGIVPPVPAARLIREERDQLLHQGIATTIVGSDGNTRIERLITTYQTSPLGAEDPTYLDVMTVRNLSNIRYGWNTRTALKWPRHILSDDTEGIGAGAPVVTPPSVRAEAVAYWDELRLNAQVENFEQFLGLLVSERDAGDADRLNAMLAFNTTNALMVLATKIGFKL